MDRVIIISTSCTGKFGLYYIKVMEDEVVYYLEQVTTQYGNKTAYQQTNDKIKFE